MVDGSRRRREKGKLDMTFPGPGEAVSKDSWFRSLSPYLRFPNKEESATRVKKKKEKKKREEVRGFDQVRLSDNGSTSPESALYLFEGQQTAYNSERRCYYRNQT